MQLSHLHQSETRIPNLLVSMLVLTGLFLVLSGLVTLIALKLFIPAEYQDSNALMAALRQGKISAPLINGLLTWQGFSAIAGFILAPMVYLFAFDKPLLIQIRKMQPWTLWSVPIAILLSIIIQPLIDFTYQVNQSIRLPESLAEIELQFRASEEQMMLLTKAIAMPQDWLGVLLSVLVIGVIPAIGEELLFRGVMQPLLIRAKVNVHISIWATAILFSLMHLQMYGFIPRALMGALFGYIYYYSGILPLSILAHAANNLLVLLVVNMTGNVETTTGGSWILAIIVIPVIGYGLSKLLPPNHKMNKLIQEDWVKVYVTSMNHRAEIVADVLEKGGYQSMVINKVDSSFHFGEFQVFVHKHEEKSAITLIENAVSFE